MPFPIAVVWKAAAGTKELAPPIPVASQSFHTRVCPTPLPVCHAPGGYLPPCHAPHFHLHLYACPLATCPLPPDVLCLLPLPPAHPRHLPSPAPPCRLPPTLCLPILVPVPYLLLHLCFGSGAVSSCSDPISAPDQPHQREMGAGWGWREQKLEKQVRKEGSTG